MDTAIRALLMAAAVLASAAAMLWVLCSAYDSLFRSSRVLLMPFELIGQEDKDNKVGGAMSQALIARIAHIRRGLSHSVRELKEVNSGALPADTGRRQVGGDSDAGLFDRFEPPPEIKLSLGGVEVGGALSWFYRALKTERAYRVSVILTEGKDHAFVTGTHPDPRERPLYMEVPSKHHQQVVEALAYGFVQQEFGSQLPEGALLPSDDFKRLLELLDKVADIKRRLPLLGSAARAEYVELCSGAEKIAAEAPAWVALQVLAARICEAADEWPRAVVLYRLAIKLAPTGDGVRDKLERSVRSVEARIEAAQLAEQMSATPDPDGDGFGMIGALLKSKATERVLQLVGATGFKTMSRRVKVAIPGGLPSQHLLPSGSVRIVGSSVNPRQSEVLTDYIDSIAQWVLALAPEAQLFFATTGSADLDKNGLLASLTALLDEEPDVVLWAYSPFTGAAETELVKRIIRGGKTLFVHAAGNDPAMVLPYGREVLKGMLVAAAVDLDGAPASFSSRPASENACWTPGVNLPTVVAKDPQGKLALQSGTGYSAAVCAGIAANLMGQQKGPIPQQTIELLLRSARPASDRTSTPIVHLGRAIAEISSGNPGPAAGS